MGVAVNYAVGFGEFAEQPVFNVMVPIAIAMGKNYFEVVNGDVAYARELLSGGHITHVPVDGVHFFALKGT